MKIYLTHGVGSGPTKNAAFDAALFDAGIANYNLIILSSMIPERAEIVEGKIDWNDKGHGNKLYVVLSRSLKKGPVCSGIGWVQSESGKGLFVEERGESREKVEMKIKASLSNMIKYRKENFGQIKTRIITYEGNKVYSCCLVSAVYKSEGWD